MKLTLRTITYHPATGDVTMMLDYSLGGGFSVTTTEAKLVARLAPGVTVWGNDEALAEAQALVATPKDFVAASARDMGQFPDEGFVVAFAPSPPPPPKPAKA